MPIAAALVKVATEELAADHYATLATPEKAKYINNLGCLASFCFLAAALLNILPPLVDESVATASSPAMISGNLVCSLVAISCCIGVFHKNLDEVILWAMLRQGTVRILLAQLVILEIAYLHMHVKFGLPFVRVIAVTGYVSQITYLLMMDAMMVRPAVLIKVMAFMGILTTALNVAKFFSTTDPVSPSVASAQSV
jgi:hypothetical protein